METTSAQHFNPLRVLLLGPSEEAYATLAREMNTSEAALKMAIRRLCKTHGRNIGSKGGRFYKLLAPSRSGESYPFFGGVSLRAGSGPFSVP